MMFPVTRTLIATASLAGLMAVGMVAEANAWTRSGTVTTARGTYTVQGGGACAYGSCSGARTVTGPYGNAVTRQGTVTRTAPGAAVYSGSVTGPNGGTVYRQGTVRRY